MNHYVSRPPNGSVVFAFTAKRRRFQRLWDWWSNLRTRRVLRDFQDMGLIDGEDGEGQ